MLDESSALRIVALHDRLKIVLLTTPLRPLFEEHCVTDRCIQLLAVRWWSMVLAAMLLHCLAAALLAAPTPAEKLETWRAEVARAEAPYRTKIAQLRASAPQELPAEFLAILDAQQKRPEEQRQWLPKIPARWPVMRQLTPDEAAWVEQARQQCREQAALYRQLAVAGIALGQVEGTWRLLHQAMAADPEDAIARVALGYELGEQGWERSETIAKRKTGYVNHPKYGWLFSEQVPRYEAGQRWYRGNWMSAEQDAKLHVNIKNGWRVETEHFTVTTNHSLEEGVKLARQLEDLLEVWQRVFVAYYLTPDELRARLTIAENLAKPLPRMAEPMSAKTAERPKPRPLPFNGKHFQVVLFVDQNDYNAALKPAQPRIEMTLGIYFASTKTAYFFAGENQDPGTIWHEATHQLFQEMRTTSPEAGMRGGFWMLEAVACYMETLESTELGWWLGGADKPRVLAARQRLLGDRFYVPLQDLTARGVKEMQADPDLPKIYSQSAGLWQFFMHGQNGALREPAISFLPILYANRATPAELSRTLGKPLGSIDTAYREYIQDLGPLK